MEQPGALNPYGSNQQVVGLGLGTELDCQHCRHRRREWTGRTRENTGDGFTIDVCTKCRYILRPDTTRKLRPEEGGLPQSTSPVSRARCEEGGERYQVAPETITVEGYMMYTVGYQCKCGRVFPKLGPLSKQGVVWIPPHGEGPA
jgi:hypothetical protein